MRIHHALRAAAGAGAGGDGFALSFDGTDDSVDFTDGTNLVFGGSSDFTIEFWFKSNVTGGFMYGTSQDSSYFDTYIYSGGAASPSFRFEGIDKTGRSLFGPDHSDGNWHHYAAVHNAASSTAYLYIDGFEVDSASIDPSGGTYNSTGEWSIATMRNRKNSDDYCDFECAEWRIWTVARTQTEIQNNANKTLTGGETGLQLYYPLNEGGGTTATDNAGSVNGSILGGATWVERTAFPDVTFEAPFALSFDGSNDYVDLNSDIMFASGGAPWGVFMWVYPATVSKLMHLTGVESSLSSWTAPSHYGIDANGKLTWWDASTSWKVSTTTLTINQWYFVGLSHDGAGNITLWVDGVKESIDPVSGNSTDCGIGNFFRRGHGTDRYYNGDAGKVIIYSEEPTEARVKDDANASLSGTETNIIAYWPTDEGGGSTLTDNAGNNDGTINDGTINDATWVERTAFPQI